MIYVTKYSSDVPGQRQEKHRENGNAESPKRCLKQQDICYDFLHLICKYTDRFYDGYDDEIQYFFFTHDSIQILKSV